MQAQENITNKEKKIKLKNKNSFKHFHKQYVYTH